MSGVLDFNGKRYEFDRALAYQDRNWGISFPKWWTWLVSNNFKGSPGTVLAAGGGRPKIFQHVELIEGMTIGLRHKGKEYTFRPNDGDIVKLDVRFGRWEVRATSLNHLRKISISAYAPPEKFMDLQFVTPEGEVFHDYEALTGQMRVSLYERKNLLSSWKLIARLESDEAGIEFGSADVIDLESLNVSSDLP